jgi:hypothetical protein
MAMIRAGFALADNITPLVGAVLGGFVARLFPSTGVDAPLLTARVLWLEDGATQGLWVGLDVLALTPATADRFTGLLAARLDLPEDRITIAASHTHSGPMTVPMRGIGPADDRYLAILADRVVEAATHAQEGRHPVRVGWGVAPVAPGVNRCQRIPGGRVVIGRNADGPADDAVRVLRLDGGDRPILLVEHACHPYCLRPESTLVSPDFWGHAAAALAERGHDAVYLNGCDGNIAPVESV